MKENYNKILTPEMKAKLRKIKHLALDMDGTIYLGSKLFPFTIDFLDRMKAAGIGYSFLTNNPTKSVADYLAKLEGMGIHATEDNMYTTSLAAIDYIKKTWPAARRLFMLGTPSMVSQFEKAGFEACAEPPGGPRRAFPTWLPTPTAYVPPINPLSWSIAARSRNASNTPPDANPT